MPPVAVGVVTPKPRALPRARPSFHPRNAQSLCRTIKTSPEQHKDAHENRGAPRQFYERAVADATAGLPASEKLDAALRVIVEYQQSYPGLRMIDIEPAQVIRRLSRVIPLMRERLERVAQGQDAELAVATAVRVAVSHYLVRSDDDDQFLDQLRHAARVKNYAPESTR